MPTSGLQRTLKFTLAYDGTPYVGWQRQAGGVSIQGLIEEALARIEGAPVAVIGAGRTDAGVHACAQVASARLTAAIDTSTLARALNATLPAEIRVVDVADAEPSFHARYDARAKTYRYHIVNGPLVSPFEWRYVWHVCERLDADRMRAAAALFEGEHDFAAFRATGSSVKTTVRRVSSSRVARGDPPGRCGPEPAADVRGTERFIYEVKAAGFLRHMVRTMVGTLVDIGCGRREAASIGRAFETGDRRDAGATAPARGLWLVSVEY